MDSKQWTVKTNPRDIHQAIVDLCDRGGDFAVAVVLKAEGSTPCKAGAKAAIDVRGAILLGTVGGGQVEAEAQRRAVEAIQAGRPVVFDFRLEGGEVADREPICGGMMRVLIDPTPGRHREAYAAAVAARRSRERGLLLTSVWGRPAWDVEVRFMAEQEARRTREYPGAEAIPAALESGEPTLGAVPSAEDPGIEFLAEPLLPNPLLLIVGGGHVGQAVAIQGNRVGFEVVVIDDRPEFTAPELFPEGTTARCGPIGEEIAGASIGSDAYVVIVTRGHGHDAEALAACIHLPAAYIGMIGSRRKVALMREDFLSSGRATAEEFARVYAPIGLDIGAVTVPEIAASIVAQLIAVRRKGRADRMPAT